MNVHGNAKLGPAGRRALVAAIAGGASMREAATRFGVSPATAHRWWWRWRQASEPQRSSLACLADRSSRPRRSPRLLPVASQQQICQARRQTGWGPRLIAGRVGHPHSTVWKVLRRHGLSRAPRASRDPARRYEWPCPGDLLHMDTKRYARFLRPGHAVTGVRDKTGAEKRAAWGCEYAHTIVDDHSRLAYSELHPDQSAATVTGFVTRALAWYEALGIRPRRIMTDNAWAYTKNASLRQLLAQHSIRQILIRPHTPRTNRQGRALPPDHEPRMGLRRHLPQPPRPRPGTAILARPLQHAAATQLTGRTTTHQPRPQPQWAGQLEG
jgi:transposase